MKNQITPDFFIIGAQKCGTTSLYHWLKDHPQIFMPENKEPHFFANLDLVSNKPFAKTLSNAILSQEEYQQIFSVAKDSQIKGEASPSYLWGNETAKKIRQINPKAKFIVLLRDPVQRAYSEYIMLVAAGLEKLNFTSAIEKANEQAIPIWGAGPMYIELGKYGTQLQQFYSNFEESQIVVIASNELRQSPEIIINNIAAFLGVDSSFWQNFDFAGNIHHKGGLPRNTVMKLLINARWARAVGRALVPKKMRPLVTSRVMIKRGKKEEISLRARQLIWERCEKEIHMVESLVGREMPELWLTYPE